MRHSQSYRKMVGMLLGMLTLSVSSCEDDFDKHRNVSGALSFMVEVSDGWSDGAASSSTSIKRMSQSADAKPLYLVTQICDSAPVDVDAEAVTRGTPVTDTDPLKTNGFGLSAICYTGTWPEGDSENNWTTNFAHNLKVFEEAGQWKTSEKLEWPGSGNIKFFAYYPYSDSDNAESENPDSENTKNCITHSGSSETGIPVLTYTVPDDVTKQPDLLWAVAEHSGKREGDGSVSLAFKHALTAVTIKTGNEMLSGKITGIRLEGVYGKGKGKIGDTTWTPEGETRDFVIDKKEESVELPVEKDENGVGINTKPGTAVTDGEYTFMMVPQNLPEGAQLIIFFTDDLTNTERTLTANIGNTTWQSGKKVTYSINSTGIVIEPVLEMKVNRDGQWPGGGYKMSDEKMNAGKMYGREMTSDEKAAYLPVSGYLHDVEITAYAKVTQAETDKEEAKEKAKEKAIELPFVIEYSINNGEWTPTKTDGYGWIPETVESAESKEGADVKSPRKGAISLPAQSQFAELQKYFEVGYKGEDGHSWLTETARTTVTEEGKGSKADPYDLVEKNPIAKESANCYIINDHGYYKFPVCYGNTYNATGNSAYYAAETTFSEGKDYQLINFVGHDDQPITSSRSSGTVWIENADNAVIVWQDSPDLVEDVELISCNGNNWISFHTAKQALSQGNAVIAVRDASGAILWSWHIWATHYNWQELSAMIPSGVRREDGVQYQLTPCNLGYCEPHKADEKRTVSIRFRVTKPDGSKEVMKPTIIRTTETGENKECPEPIGEGVITFTQPAIAESIAGDNTYYQWGRKDPMLPGVYDEVVYDNGVAEKDKDTGLNTNELTMNNKMFYSTPAYRFDSDDTSKSIGESIRAPHHFFIHQRPKDDATFPIDNLKRRHWHEGRKSAGKKTSYDKQALMNYWNTLLDKPNKQNTKDHPNGIYVAKTIYDPSPAGYKIPSPNAYTGFDSNELSRTIETGENVCNKDQKVGWKISLVNGGTIFYPATGVRNIGLKSPWDHTWGTFPAFADLTFIASAGFIYDQTSSGTYSCTLFSIDNRNPPTIKANYATANAYGFALRPVLDVVASSSK